jgi:bifunctional non-homologous end joining protein LigD
MTRTHSVPRDAGAKNRPPQRQGAAKARKFRQRLDAVMNGSQRRRIMLSTQMRHFPGDRGADTSSCVSGHEGQIFARPVWLCGSGDVVFRHACKLGLEGIVSKKLGSYRSGRSRYWVKSKNPKHPAGKREAEEEWGR